MLAGAKLLIYFLCILHIECWTLNDLYEQFLQNANYRHSRNPATKRKEFIRRNRILKAQPHQSEDENYEVQTFDVATERREKTPRIHTLQKHSQVFSPEYREGADKYERKPQVTAWSDWTLGSNIVRKKSEPGRPKNSKFSPMQNVGDTEKQENEVANRKQNVHSKPDHLSSIKFLCKESSPSVLCPTATTIGLKKDTASGDLSFTDVIQKVADSEKEMQQELQNGKDSTENTDAPSAAQSEAVSNNQTATDENNNDSETVDQSSPGGSTKLQDSLKAMGGNDHSTQDSGGVSQHSSKDAGKEHLSSQETTQGAQDATQGAQVSNHSASTGVDTKAQTDSVSAIAQAALDNIKNHTESNTNDEKVQASPKPSNQAKQHAPSFPPDTIELPNLQRILSSNFDKQNYKFRNCLLVATSSKACGIKVVFTQSDTGECNGKISFTALLKQLLPETNVATPTNDMIVPGKFDSTGFEIDRCTARVSFDLNCRELFDVIPNKIRLSKAQISCNFSYESQPKGMENFRIDIHGSLDLNFHSRKILVSATKADGSTLFKFEMSSTDLEIPEFTRLFTGTEVSQDNLPPDLQTLLTSSLRGPRVTGLYESNGGAFEFIASAKSPASIFPSQPWVYIIIQKPRLGKCVSGIIASFVNAVCRSFLSSILEQDLSNIPFITDTNVDMAIGIATDSLFVVKDERFNKEVGYLFNAGKTIKCGLTIKIKLPIKKLLSDLENPKILDRLPENCLINIEVKNNKMQIDFPEDIRINLGGVAPIFAQHGQEFNFPKDLPSLEDVELKIDKYEVVDINNKVLLVEFSAPQPMEIGSVMSVKNVIATLKRDALLKWSFVLNGDCLMGQQLSVGVTLISKADKFELSSKPTSVRSSLLVKLLDKNGKLLTPELAKYNLEDFVIENFKIAGTISEKNVIRFTGVPSVFDSEDNRIEFIAAEDSNKIASLVMGMLCKSVNADVVLSRMLDRKMVRRSWATNVNIGLFMCPNDPTSQTQCNSMQFESEGLSRTKIPPTPGMHLRVLLTRPEYDMCKGDSLCRVLSAEMPRGSAFHLSGGIQNSEIKLGASIKEPLVLSRSLQLTDVSLQVLVKDSIKIFVLASLSLQGISITFKGVMDVDNTGLLQLNMSSDMPLEEPFQLSKIRFTKCSLNTVFEPGVPLPIFELKALLQIGDKSQQANLLETDATLKINSQDPSKNSFAAIFNKMSFDKLATAFGTKKPLSKFQQDAVFDGEALFAYKQTAAEETTPGAEATAKSNTFNYKGELKMTGRIKILGLNAEYTIKFLQKSTQLLIEIWLPDIGISQGLLTIRAGLKVQKQSSDTQTASGPTFLIRMDPLTNSAVIVGKFSTLAFSRVAALKVEDAGYSATIFARMPNNVNANVSLFAKYTDEIENAKFTVSAILPIQTQVKKELFKILHKTAMQTKKTLLEAEDRVTTTEKIYEQTKAMIDKYKKRSNAYTADIREKADIITKLRKGIKRHCVEDCGESCMGLPSWKRSGISFAGRNAIGAPMWDSCRRKIPDLNCITRCLGRKVIENVKANNKQSELQVLMAQLTETKRSLQDAKSLVDRARVLVDATLDDLEKVNTMIKTGVEISKFLNDGRAEDKIDILQVSFKDTLENAEKGLVNFNIELTYHGENKILSVYAALDGNLETNVAEAIVEKLYPGYSEFNKKLEEVKVILSNLDGQKANIMKDIERNQDDTRDKSEDKRAITWTTEEDEFRRLAFGELPRFTLSDDETIHAFEEKSLWNVAPTNNPLYDTAPGDNQIVNKDGEKTRAAFMHELDKPSSCGQLRSSVNKYSDIINPLSEFTESFLQEKIMFYRQKNRRLADLRMIDDQIKSDCFLENCTMEDMDNALSYLSRARDGTLKWANEIDGQIEQQNKVALHYFSQRTADIISVDGGISLKQYISKVKEVAQNAIRKSDVGSKRSETDDKIQRLAKELHGLLLGVKSGEELSKVAPRIFSMKRQIIALKRNKIPCSEWKVEKPTYEVSLDKKSPTQSILAVLSKDSKTTESDNGGEKKLLARAPHPTRSMKRSHTSAKALVTENPVLKSHISHREAEKNKKLGEKNMNMANMLNKKELIQTQENFNQLFFNDNTNTDSTASSTSVTKRSDRNPNSNPANPFSYWNKYGSW